MGERKGFIIQFHVMKKKTKTESLMVIREEKWFTHPRESQLNRGGAERRRGEKVLTRAGVADMTMISR